MAANSKNERRRTMKRKLKFHVLEITIVDVIESAELIEQPEQVFLTDEQYEQIKNILSNGNNRFDGQ